MAGWFDGVLPAVFSAGDTMKRNVKGLISDPRGYLESINQDFQAENQKRDQRVQALLSPSVMDPGASDQAAREIAQNAGNWLGAGITVYHGSPHAFSKFDASKIGTGEGAQAYGHGLYLAEAPEVAKTYAPPQRTWQQIKNGKASSEGNLYKVDLPDSAVAEMLDWDKPLSQQAPEVQKRLERAYPGVTTGEFKDRTLQGWARNGVDPRMSQVFQDVGIPGIRYLDGGSRGAGQGTSNYVVFPGNEGLLNIMERNGQPIR